jgi:hypothetical protein
MTLADRAAIVHVLKAQRDALNALIALLEGEATPAARANAAPALSPPLVPADDQQRDTINPNTARSHKFRARRRANGIGIKEPGRTDDLIAARRCNTGATVQALHPVAPVAPVSLSEVNSLISNRILEVEREEGATLHPLHPATAVASGRRHHLPADFQPDTERGKLALNKLGEAAAAKCLGKFKRHHTTGQGSRVKHTAEGWQDRYESWVDDENVPLQRNLPLLASVQKSRDDRPSTVWRLEKAIQETLALRRKEA